MGNSSTRSSWRLSTPTSVLDVLPSSALHVVMLGLDSAGKTTVLYRLKLDQYVNTVPTIGFNCERVKASSGGARGVSFVVWDVGGQDKLRPLWRSYTRRTDAIVFVVDSVDADRMEEARTELFKTIKMPENGGVPVLLLANKQDLPGALEIEELEERLSMKELTPLGHLWDVASCCAITGDGLDDSLEKLHSLVVERRRRTKERPTSGLGTGRRLSSGSRGPRTSGDFSRKNSTTSEAGFLPKQRSITGFGSGSTSSASFGDRGS